MPTTTMWMAIVAAALPQPSPATWTLVEDLRIGAHDGPSALTVVSHATTNSREDVLFLAQPQERVIRRFDARSGRPLGVFGRRGSGPGEFQSISGMAFRNDTLFAADLFQGRIEAFSAEGVHLETITVRSVEYGQVSARSLAPSGFVWGESLFHVSPGAETDRPILLMDREGRTVRVVAEQPMGGAAGAAVAPSGRVLFFVQPFALLRHLRAYAPDGASMVFVDAAGAGGGGNDAHFTLTKYSDQGHEIFRFRVSYTPRPLPREVRDSILGSFTLTLGSPARARSVVNLPEAGPPVEAVLIDTVGRTWLRRMFVRTSEPNLIILDEAGVVVARATVPAHVRLLHGTRSHIWGVMEDESGVPIVVRYTIVER